MRVNQGLWHGHKNAFGVADRLEKRTKDGKSALNPGKLEMATAGAGNVCRWYSADPRIGLKAAVVHVPCHNNRNATAFQICLK